MRRLLSLLLILSFCFTLSAQSDCYSEPRKKGIEALNKKKFDDAKRFFEAAKKCPTKPKHDDVDVYLKKIEAAKRGQGTAKKPTSNSPSPKPSEPVKKNNFKIHALNTVERSGCRQGRMGIEVTADFYAENLKGKDIYGECIVVPIESDKVTDKYSKTQFNLGGKPGVRGRNIYVEENYQYFSDAFFVPFGAMDIHDYEDQSFEIIVNIYCTEDSKEPIEDGSLAQYMSLEPISLFVDNDIKDKYLSFSCYGGSQDFDISVCDNILWLNVPSWIEIPQGAATMFIAENKETTRREAVLTIQSRDGGNTVDVHVTQDAAKEKVVEEKPLAQINDVRLEHNVKGPDGSINTVFHVNLDIRKQKGNRIQVYALLYNADGRTRLLDKDGSWITCHGSATPRGDDVTYDDFHFYLDNNLILNASNAQENEASIYIMVTFDEGDSWAAQSGPYTITW